MYCRNLLILLKVVFVVQRPIRACHFNWEKKKKSLECAHILRDKYENIVAINLTEIKI